MTRRGVSDRVLGVVDARSIGIVCFGLGVVAFWALRERGEYFGAVVPLFLVTVAGLLLGYSTGYEHGRSATGDSEDG
jgi:hypothetical protein